MKRDHINECGCHVLHRDWFFRWTHWKSVIKFKNAFHSVEDRSKGNFVAEKEAGRDGARSNECVHCAKYRIQRKQVIKFHELYRFTWISMQFKWTNSAQKSLISKWIIWESRAEKKPPTTYLYLFEWHSVVATNFMKTKMITCARMLSRLESIFGTEFEKNNITEISTVNSLFHIVEKKWENPKAIWKRKKSMNAKEMSDKTGWRHVLSSALLRNSIVSSLFKLYPNCGYSLCSIIYLSSSLKRR